MLLMNIFINTMYVRYKSNKNNLTKMLFTSTRKIFLADPPVLSPVCRQTGFGRQVTVDKIANYRKL
jgi:hypothetical protein